MCRVGDSVAPAVYSRSAKGPCKLKGHRDDRRSEAASLAATTPDNSTLGSKLSSFLNFFCPPSAPELMRCEFDRQACRCLLQLRTRVVCSTNNERGCGRGTT